MSARRIADLFMLSGWLFGFVLSLFLMSAVYESMYEYGNDRATFNKGEIVGWLNKDGELDVLFSRDFTIHKSGDLDIIRTFLCTAANGDVSEYTMPAVRRKLEARYYPPRNRYFQTPMKQSAGDKCRITVHILWYPRLALSGRLIVIADDEFIVQEKRP